MIVLALAPVKTVTAPLRVRASAGISMSISFAIFLTNAPEDTMRIPDAASISSIVTTNDPLLEVMTPLATIPNSSSPDPPTSMKEATLPEPPTSVVPKSLNVSPTNLIVKVKPLAATPLVNSIN